MNSIFSPFRKTATLAVGMAVLLVSDAVAQVATSVPQMLDRALPSVVTVALYKMQGTKRSFGYASDQASAAYERALDLSGAAASGSGFVIEREGRQYVVTNAHVVEQAAGDASIAVYSINQTKYAARVIGGDSFYDVAVLELTGNDSRPEIRTISFKTDEPRIGEPVFSIGNPLGKYPYTVTQGIIGGKNRVQEGLTGKFGYLQSSATIIWGNSGGPLVDADGKVAGINTKIEIKRIGDQSFIQPQINFALEARIARRIIDDMFSNNGRVRRSFYGLEIRQSYRVEGENGSRVTIVDPLPVITGVVPGAPGAAALAGKEGSVITRINTTSIRNLQEALGAMEEIRPGEQAIFELERSGKKDRVSLRTGELTTTALGTLAQFLLGRHASLTAKDGNGGVVLGKSAPEGKQEIQRDDRLNSKQEDYQYEKSSKQYRKTRGSGSELTVVAAGLVIEGGESTIWRVKNLSDLGVALRLATLSGVVDFVPDSNEGTDAKRLVLSGEDNVVAETLLY